MMHGPRKWLVLALALNLVVGGCLPADTTPSPPPTVAGACREPEVIVLDQGWRFRTDPDDVGLSQRWFAISKDDTAWRQLTPGEPWEFSGVEHDGVAWYRTTLTLPTWSRVYLGLGRVDDAATLWVDGEKKLTWQAGDPEAQTFNLTGVGEPGDRITLAIRIEDHGGYGGIKGPSYLSSEPRGVMVDVDYIRRLFDSHPEWPRPDWVDGSPVAWTMSGAQGAGEKALVRSDGAVAPWADAPTAEIWLYDPAAARLTTGTHAQTAFSLVRGDLPLPEWQWEGLGAQMQSTLFRDLHQDAVRWQVSVHNSEQTARDLVLLLVLRPFGINRSLAPMCSLALQGSSRIWVDGAPFLIAASPPAEAGVASLDEAMRAATQGRAPSESTSYEDATGLGAAVLAYPLSLSAGQSETFHFAFPTGPETDDEQGAFPNTNQSTEHRLQLTADSWEEALDRVNVQLPDELLEQALRASTAYLLIAIDPEGPHPGPLAHSAVWVRDAAYTGLALLQLGYADVVRDYVPDILGAQESTGRVPPIQGEEVPWDDDEWDAQGQAILLATSYYRYTGDLEALEAWYPTVQAAARFISHLRATTAQSIGPTRGLLPPSKSAEDLGPTDQHYYWDNLWAVAGLEEAAFAARELGIPEDASWMEAEADALRGAILRSVEDVMGPRPAYIPGAVEDLDSSAMARGTVPALWPIRVLSPQDLLVQRSFEAYYQRWIAPDGGAFRHRQGQFWPYGGLELAHAYLRLGDMDVLHEILGWTLNHQTLPGTFAWAEQVDPETGGISGGDMPHAWAAGSYATLVREMLVSERGQQLELLTGAPNWWLEAENTIALQDAPTHFGLLNLRTESTVQVTDTGWDGTLTLNVSGAEPPDGFRWRLPYEPIAVEGPPDLLVENGYLIIRGGGGSVHLTFAPDG